jgi:hypothetical protein
MNEASAALTAMEYFDIFLAHRDLWSTLLGIAVPRFSASLGSFLEDDIIFTKADCGLVFDKELPVEVRGNALALA